MMPTPTHPSREQSTHHHTHTARMRTHPHSCPRRHKASMQHKSRLAMAAMAAKPPSQPQHSERRCPPRQALCTCTSTSTCHSACSTRHPPSPTPMPPPTRRACNARACVAMAAMAARSSAQPQHSARRCLPQQAPRTCTKQQHVSVSPQHNRCTQPPRASAQFVRTGSDH
jgi:hypothetical protein